MFESNFPPDKGQCSYQVIFNAFKRIAAPYSEAEKTALFSKTATDFYRLGLGWRRHRRSNHSNPASNLICPPRLLELFNSSTFYFRLRTEVAKPSSGSPEFEPGCRGWDWRPLRE
jgi:hypothetical protein